MYNSNFVTVFKSYLTEKKVNEDMYQDNIGIYSGLEHFKSFASEPLVLANYYSYNWLLKKTVGIHKVEKTLGTSSDQIFNLLAQYEYYALNDNDYELTYDQTKVLTREFEKALRNQFKQLLKRSKHGISKADLKLLQYFRRFINNGDALTESELLESKISSELVENWAISELFSLNEISYGLSEWIPKYFLNKLKYRIKKIHFDSRPNIYSYTVSHHYYIFPSEDEEDVSEKSAQITSFSETNGTSFSKVLIVRSAIKINVNERNSTINKKNKCIQSVTNRQEKVGFCFAGAETRYGQVSNNPVWGLAGGQNYTENV